MQGDHKGGAQVPPPPPPLPVEFASLPRTTSSSSRPHPRAAAREVSGWPNRCKLELAHAFLWKYGCKRLKLAQLLGQLGVLLTCSLASPNLAFFPQSRQEPARYPPACLGPDRSKFERPLSRDSNFRLCMPFEPPPPRTGISVPGWYLGR
jgi:hypothetical protein